MRILDHLERPNEVVMIISLTFFILVLLTPVFTLGTLQNNNLRAVVLLAILQIVNGLLLVTLWAYISKNRKLLIAQPNSGDYNNMYANFSVIPFVYLVSILIGFVNVQVAAIFPVLMIPMILILTKFHRR